MDCYFGKPFLVASPTPIEAPVLLVVVSKLFHDCAGKYPMWLADLFRLYALARRRLRSEDDYKLFQAFQARLLLQYLRRYRVQLPGKLVLDLGSGIGGYSEVLAATCARVISPDV